LARGVLAGLFITFEGLDKSGKTTQAELLVKNLRDDGREVVFTREPGGTELGRRVREVLLHSEFQSPVSPITEMLLYFADRAQHVEEVIRPALESGKVVISDRYSDSTIAYQGYGRGMHLPQLRAVQEAAEAGIRPDLTVLMDVDVATAQKRMEMEGADRMERAEAPFHERVREGFLALSREEPDRFVRLDGLLPIEDLSREIFSEVRKRLGSERPRRVGGRAAR
jgi:dTMP kinase